MALNQMTKLKQTTEFVLIQQDKILFLSWRKNDDSSMHHVLLPRR